MNRPGAALITLDPPLDIVQGGKPVCRVGPWTIGAGDRWWVRGPNGCGKSSLLRLLAGQLWPAPGQHENRGYHFDDKPTWSPLSAKGRVALLDADQQNRYLQHDWDLTAAEVVATGFLGTDLLHRRPDPREFHRLEKLMIQSEAQHLWHRPFLQLSQGERRRVLIARALAKNPDILLLDEFSEGLDQPSREMLWDHLESLARSGTAIVLATHRAVPALEGWQVLDVNPAPDHTLGDERPPPAWCSPGTGKTLVEASGSLYLEGRLLIQNLHWTLREGEHTVVSGPNGCGKTSLLRLLWGELRLARGGSVVHFDDPGLALPALRHRVGYFQPEMHAWFSPEDVAEAVVLSGLHSTVGLRQPVTDEDRRRAREAAEVFQAAALLTRSFGSLSYGQGRRVLLARTLVAQPALALLDEPFDGLDGAVRRLLFHRLGELAAAGVTTFVMASHHGEDRPHWIRHSVIIHPDRTLEKLRDRPANMG